MIPLLQLAGDHFTTGRQHGEQVAGLRPLLLAAMRRRLASLRRLDSLNRQAGDFTEDIRHITGVWEAHAPGTLAMLRGIAQALDLDWEDYFPYTVASYLADQRRRAVPGEGCTTWAAGAGYTVGGASLLVKNRDYRPEHQGLQCLARVHPAAGHPYLCLTSAGSPGVFSSGVNAAGLAVADTHVVSRDTGPGIARYSLMMDLLEQCSRVDEAIAYLHTRPHLGDGTVTLADAQGDMAVFEITHSVQGVRQAQEGFLVSTNHFSLPETQALSVDTSPPALQGNSRERRRAVEAALAGARGQVDVAWSQRLMARHGDGLHAICRHPEQDPDTVTISSVALLPQAAGLWVANGPLCQAPYEFFPVV